MNNREIVVATDFSDVAENAMNYACAMGKALNMTVTLVHSYVLPITFSETPMPIISMDETRDLAIDKLKAVADKAEQQHEGLKVHAKVLYGDITEALKEYENEHKPAFIVVGNSGSGKTSLWMGSNVTGLMRNLHTTVVAIPPDVSFKKPEHICLSCDVHDLKKHLPKQAILDMTDNLGATLHVLHVEAIGDTGNAATAEAAQWLSEQFPNSQFHTVTADTVESVIVSFVKEHEVDWLITIPKKHSFWHNLFHRTHTEGILKIEGVPVAALHAE